MSLTWWRVVDGQFVREYVVHDPRVPYWKLNGAGELDGRYLDYDDVRDAMAASAALGTDRKLFRVNLTREARMWPTKEDLRKVRDDYEQSGAPERVAERLKAIEQRLSDEAKR